MRQRRRKALAGIAVLLGTTAVTAMLALATTIGDRIHRELAVYGANIVVFPKAANLSVNIAGVEMKPSTGGAYLHESDIARLKTIFWANNIKGLSPELSISLHYIANGGNEREVGATGFWFDHAFGNGFAETGAPQIHPSWKVQGVWPKSDDDVVLGIKLARTLGKETGDVLYVPSREAMKGNTSPAAEKEVLRVTGVADTASIFDEQVLMRLGAAQRLSGKIDAVSRIDVSATTIPEDSFARKDPDSLPAKQREIWYCRPYANSIAYQIREAIPGAQAEQVRRVEQSEGTLLARVSGLMWLISAAALLAAAFAVSAAMATAVLERRGEIGLMRSLGASKRSIALLFYAESGLLAVAAGVVGYLAGSALAYWLGARTFAGDTAGPVLNAVLLPVVVMVALVISIAGSTPSIRTALRMDPSAVLRADR